jgi:hypothetical protein
MTTQNTHSQICRSARSQEKASNQEKEMRKRRKKTHWKKF